ncbi:DUF4062 domain-containing protein [Kineococcus sp. LSe6-4]|uniref:DUF4062 domain-containing protein n=1 Tax=Kineococcus halophytocola TaxID=3234027 RepID=A0ABV4H623_9ACTN
MPSIRHQAFLSSTYLDLVAERAALTQALLRMRQVIPAGMELFSADSRPPWGVITSILADTDYLVLVIAGRYGSVDEDGISYTEREYDYAIAHGIPVLAFVHNDPGALRADAVETTQTGKRALAAFRAKVEGAHTVQRWQTVDELVHEVTRALHNAFVDHPRPGWVRGGEATASTPSAATTAAGVVATAGTRGPQLQLQAASADGRMLQPVTSSEAHIAAYVQAAVDELLEELPTSNTENAGGGLDFSAGQWNLGGILRHQASLNALEVHHDEDRTEEEYRQEVAQYGQKLEAALHEALDDVAAHVLVPFAPIVTNLTERNYQQVQVELHVEGDVRALEPGEEDDDLDPLARLPRRPRKWGPWTSSKLAEMVSQIDYRPPRLGGFGAGSFASSVEIENGGSATLRYGAIHLRPGAETALDSVVLVVPEGTASPLRATWRATATNVDGQTRGELEVPVEGDALDLWDALRTTS